MVQKIEIEGIAIVEGKSRNNIYYTSKELEKFAPTLTGRPILKDHTNETDKTIGKVVKCESIDGGKKVRYKGWVKEDGTGIVEKIKDGRISEVSIGAMAGKLIKESEDSEYVIAKDLVGLELSTTPVPGVVGTSLSHSNKTELTEEKLKEIINDYMKENIETTLQQNLSCSQSNVIEKVKKEDKMESEENKTKVEVKENTETTEKLVSANKEIEALKEQLRQNAISVYTEKATAKGVNTIDISKLTTEAISALTLQLDNIKVAEKVERKEVKEVAQPKTEDVKESVKSYDNFGGYVIESSDLGGIAFFKVN